MKLPDDMTSSII